MISDKLGCEICVAKPWAFKRDLKDLLEKRLTTKDFEEGLLSLIEDHINYEYTRYDRLAEVMENADRRVVIDVLSDIFEPEDIVKDGEWS